MLINTLMNTLMIAENLASRFKGVGMSDITNQEIIDLTKMNKDEICHIKCHQRKQLMRENKKLRYITELIKMDLDKGDFYYSAIYKGSQAWHLARNTNKARETLKELDGEK